MTRESALKRNAEILARIIAECAVISQQLAAIRADNEKATAKLMKPVRL